MRVFSNDMALQNRKRYLFVFKEVSLVMILGP